MKNKKIVISLLISMMCLLSACGKSTTHTESNTNHTDTKKEVESADAKQEYAEDTNTKSDTIDEFWYENRFFRSETNNKDIFYVRPANNGAELDISCGNSMIAYFQSPLEYEILDEKEGQVLRYTFNIDNDDYHVTILYYVDLDKVGVSVLKGVTGDLSTDIFYYDEAFTSKSPKFNYGNEQSSTTATANEYENLDMPDQGQIEYDEGYEYSEDEILDLLIGTFYSQDYNDLEIIDNGDYTYSVNIGIYRLCSIECSGYYDGGYIYFTGDDPSENLISGYVELGGSSSEVHLVFTDSTWEYLPNGSDFYFERQ